MKNYILIFILVLSANITKADENHNSNIAHNIMDFPGDFELNHFLTPDEHRYHFGKKTFK